MLVEWGLLLAVLMAMNDMIATHLLHPNKFD